jgi:predicted  nucleic acid-binding Zn-ribbon protein
MESFDLLEQKVRRAADLVVKLRKENKALEEDLGKARSHLHEAEKRLAALERAQGGEPAKELESLERELKTLRHERDEIRKRIAKLVEVLETLE